MLKRILLAIFVVVFSMAVAHSAIASDYQFDTKVTKKAGVVAKIFERINLLTKFSAEDKAKYWQKLTDIRLAELKMEVDDKNFDLVEETASRYSTYLGNYAGFLIAKKVIGQKQTFLDQTDSRLGILTELRDRFEYDSAWWLMIQHDINTIGIFKDRLSQQL